MEYIGWRFAPLNGGPIQGYTNSAMEIFKGSDLFDNIAREICQNSLDAKKDPNSNEPVKVVFKLLEVKKKDYDVFEGLEKCIKGCERYWGDQKDAKLKTFIEGFNDTINKEKINCLVVSDYNTKGLEGSRSQKNDTPWTALTSSDGTSYKESSESAGFYGIGKNAPFACSSLSCVFYNTLDIEGISAFKGVAKLATLLNENNKPTQGVGYYQFNNDIQEEWKPINENDNCSFRDLINEYTGRKENIGTDIVILGFNEDNWEDNIIQAAIKNFLLAIAENKLIVEVSGKLIDSNSIKYYLEKFKDNTELRKFYYIYEALNAEPQKITILDEGDADFYIKSSIGIGKIIARFRNTGMLINTFRINMLQDYAALFVARGSNLNKLLRDTEPARHNRWDYKLIPSALPDERKKAKDAIDKIEKEIRNILINAFEQKKHKEVDSGLGDVLPGTEEGFDDFPNEDVMRIKQRIDSIEYKKSRKKIKLVGGTKGLGMKIKDKIINHHTPGPILPHPRPKPIPPKPRVVDEGDDLGIIEGDGKKIIPKEKIGKFRSFPVAANSGIYKLVIMPNSDYEKVFISFNEIGEDDNKDLVNLEYYMVNNKKNKCNNEIGPIKLEKGKTEQIIFKTNVKERMILQVVFKEALK